MKKMNEIDDILMAIHVAMEKTTVALGNINKTLGEIETTMRLWSEMEANK